MADRTIGKTRTYSTFAAAIAASTAGDNLIVDDDIAYKENVLPVINLTIGARSGHRPNVYGLLSANNSSAVVTYSGLISLNTVASWSVYGSVAYTNCVVFGGGSWLLDIGANAPTFKAYNSTFVYVGNGSNRPCMYLNTTATLYNCTFINMNGVGTSPVLHMQGGTVDLYNSVVLHVVDSYDSVLVGAGTLNSDYNIVNKSIGDANGVVRTARLSGLLKYSFPNAFSYSGGMGYDDRVTGTAVANGVDLTTVSELDADCFDQTRGASFDVGPGTLRLYVATDPDTVIDTAGGNFVTSTLTNAKILLNTAWGLIGLGSRVDAPVTSVEDGTLYGPDGTGLEGELIIDYASGDDLRLGVTQNSGAIVGNLVLPTAGQIEAGVPSDSNGSVLGTFDPLGPKPDPLVSIEVTSIGDGFIIVDVVTPNLTDTVYVPYRTSEQEWQTPVSRIGSGSLTINGTNAVPIQAQGYINNGGADSNWSIPVIGTPSAGTCPVSGNPDWPRWIFASICKHFTDCKGDLQLFIEGQYRNINPPKDHLELRIDGPRITEMSKNYYKMYTEVNVLVHSAMDDENYHRIHEDVGKVASMFTTINLYKYGNNLTDTQEHFGCLTLLQNTQTRDSTQINHFGQIDPKVRLMQATVEGHYEVQLQGD